MNFRSNSSKTIDCSKDEIEYFFSRNIKKRLLNYNNKNNTNNESDKGIKKIKNNTTIKFYSRNIPMKYNYKKILPSSLCKNNQTKYDNVYIFGKRELAFKRSIKKGRKVFKYTQSTFYDDEEPKKSIIQKNNSLYLTETLNKRNNSMLPLIDKDKSILDDVNITFLNNDKINKNKNILNLKKINGYDEKENEIKRRKEYLRAKKLKKKNDLISKNDIKNIGIKNYINNLKEYLTEKFTLDIKNEKYKIIKETNNTKIGKIKETIQGLKDNYQLFEEDFLPTMNEYIKKFNNQREIERQKDMAYLNQLYLLEKSISSLKNKINKCQNEKEFLIKEIYLQICIKEKRLNLPEYYKDILVGGYTKDEVKKKYYQNTNINLDDKEIDRILKYKNNIDGNEEEVIVETMQKIENNNIKLLEDYYESRLGFFKYKKYKKQLREEIKKD
jgi:hypothetical protein